MSGRLRRWVALSTGAALIGCAGRSTPSPGEDPSCVLGDGGDGDAGIPADTAPDSVAAAHDAGLADDGAHGPPCAPIPPSGVCDGYANRLPQPERSTGACAVGIVAEDLGKRITGFVFDCVGRNSSFDPPMAATDDSLALIAQAWTGLSFVPIDHGVMFHDLTDKRSRASLVAVDPLTRRLLLDFEFDGDYRLVSGYHSFDLALSAAPAECRPAHFPFEARAISWPGDRTLDDATALEVVRAIWNTPIGWRWEFNAVSTPLVLRTVAPGSTTPTYLVILSVQPIPEGI